jgi:signal transduction histidine kinase
MSAPVPTPPASASPIDLRDLIGQVVGSMMREHGVQALEQHLLPPGPVDLPWPHLVVLRGRASRHFKVIIALDEGLWGFLRQASGKNGLDQGGLLGGMITDRLRQYLDQLPLGPIDSHVLETGYHYCAVPLEALRFDHLEVATLDTTTLVGHFRVVVLAGAEGAVLRAENLLMQALIERLDAEVTERKRQQEELRRLYERTSALVKELRQADQVKSRFLANMSHELRTPMNGILGFVDLLQRRNRDPGQREFLSIIHRSADDLLGLLNNVLDFSRIDAGHLRLEALPFDVEALVRETCELAQGRNHNGVVLVADLDLFPLPLLGDSMRVRQVVRNLLDNALKFTEQGRVVVRARRENGLVLEIDDTGVGIAPEKLAGVFRPFEQEDVSTTRRFGGSGLGLAIVQGLVELMRGKLEVESDVGRGSRFRVRLPLAEGAPSPRVQTLGALQGLRVALFDSDPISREVLVRDLRQLRAEVRLLEGPEQALELDCDYDLVLLCDLHPEVRRIALGVGAKAVVLCSRVPEEVGSRIQMRPLVRSQISALLDNCLMRH